MDADLGPHELHRDDHDVVARLFAAVRDGIRYDPYNVSGDPDDYRASNVLRSHRGYCVQKSVVLTPCFIRSAATARSTWSTSRTAARTATYR